MASFGSPRACHHTINTCIYFCCTSYHKDHPIVTLGLLSNFGSFDLVMSVIPLVMGMLSASEFSAVTYYA